jgi:hypothetical protein
LRIPPRAARGLAAHLAIYLLLLLSFGRSLLFGDGYTTLGYWTGYSAAVMHALNRVGAFSLYLGYYASTTPIFQLPILAPNLLLGDPVLATKLDLALIFAWYYVASYLLSGLAYGTLSRRGGAPPLRFAVPFVLLMFANYGFMYAVTGAMVPVAFGIPIFLYLLLKSYRIYAGLDGRIRDYAKLSLALSLMALGDPRFFVWGSIALAGLVVFALISRRGVGRALRALVYPIALSIPVVIIMFLIWTLGSSPFHYASPRPLTYSEVNWFSRSYPLLSYFQLGGMYWPAFIYSPPSVLWLKGDLNSMAASGHPPSVLMPWDPLGYVWLALTLSWFVAAAISMALVARGEERAHSIGFLILFSMAIGTYFPVGAAVDALIMLGKSPIVGGVWAITYAIPNYFMWAVIPFAIFYLALLLARLSSPGAGGRLGRAALPILVALLLIPNWQFFGFLYPGQYTPVLPGNGISGMGPLAPAAMPADVQRVYDMLSGNFDGSYNVVWPQAYGFAYKWSPRTTPWYPPGSGPPGQFYSYFSEIAERGEAYLVKPLMDAYGVRYIVVDNTSYSEVSPLAVGMTNAQVARFLEGSPGIVLAINDSPDLLVFEDPGASTVQGYSLALSPEGRAPPLSVLYYFSALLGEEPLLINGSPGIPLPVDEARIGGAPYALYTYDYFSAIQSAPRPPENYFNYSPSAGIYALSGQWYFESLRGSGTLDIEGGRVALSAGSPGGSIAQLSYGDFLAPGRTAIPIPEGCGADVSVSYYFNGSAGSYVGTSIWANDANYTRHGGWLVASNEVMGRGEPERVALSAVVPPGQAYFEVQINPAFNGSVEVWGVSINYSFFRVVDGYPVGIPALYTYDYFSAIQSAPRPPENYFNYSPSAGIYALSGQWYFESLRGSGTLDIEGGRVALSAGSPGGSIAQLSYGDFLAPGRTAIPIPEGCGADVSVSYYFNGSAGSYVGTSIWANDANYTRHGGWLVASNEVMGRGEPERVALSAVVPPGQAYFEVQINPAFNGSVEVWGVSINYSFFRVASSSTLERAIGWTGGGRELAILYAGNGTLTVNGATYRLDSGGGVGELRLSVEGEGANLSASGLSIGGMIVAEGNAAPGPVDLFSGFSPLTGTLELRPAPGITYLALATPAYGWGIQGGRYLGFDEMGREAFLISPASHLYVRDALLVNALEYAFAAAFYAALLLVFAPIRIRRGARDPPPGGTPAGGTRRPPDPSRQVSCP